MLSKKTVAATLGKAATLKAISLLESYQTEPNQSRGFYRCPTREFLRRELTAILLYLSTARLPTTERKRPWCAFSSTLRKIRVLDT